MLFWHLYMDLFVKCWVSWGPKSALFGVKMSHFRTFWFVNDWKMHFLKIFWQRLDSWTVAVYYWRLELIFIKYWVNGRRCKILAWSFGATCCRNLPTSRSGFLWGYYCHLLNFFCSVLTCWLDICFMLLIVKKE